MSRVPPPPPRRGVPPPSSIEDSRRPPARRRVPPPPIPDVEITQESDDVIIEGDDFSSTRVEMDYESLPSSLEVSPMHASRGRRPPSRRAPRPPDDPAGRTNRARRRARAGTSDLARTGQTIMSEDLKGTLVSVDTSVQSKDNC